jgi:hypothetical protein
MGSTCITAPEGYVAGELPDGAGWISALLVLI